ncbi:hypothetical protein HGM15179_020308, partial [Zosterops borbonicus]
DFGPFLPAGLSPEVLRWFASSPPHPAVCPRPATAAVLCPLSWGPQLPVSAGKPRLGATGASAV